MIKIDVKVKVDKYLGIESIYHFPCIQLGLAVQQWCSMGAVLYGFPLDKKIVLEFDMSRY
jgi:hypothetical protein